MVGITTPLPKDIFKPPPIHLPTHLPVRRSLQFCSKFPATPFDPKLVA